MSFKHTSSFLKKPPQRASQLQILNTRTLRHRLNIHRLEKSRSQRILWLLEELQLNYTLQTFKRVNMFAPPELTAVHPLGKSPVITIESEATSTPITIAESGFIIEYLIDHFGPWLAPARYREGMEGKVGGETEEWMRYRYLMHYGEGSLMTLLVTAVLLRGEPALASIFPQYYTKEARYGCKDGRGSPPVDRRDQNTDTRPIALQE